MGKRGPKPKPTAAKRRAGNPGRRKLNDQEPQPTPGAPPMPAHVEVNPLAIEIWNAACANMAQQGTLAQSDGAAIAMYACNYARQIKMEIEVFGDGPVAVSDKGNDYIAGKMQVLALVQKVVISMIAILGLSPTARTGIHATPPVKTKTKRERLMEPPVLKFSDAEQA